MNIKRYCEGLCGGMVEHPDGEYYSRADLIAAGCLVTVPDGACKQCKAAGFYLAPNYGPGHAADRIDCALCKGTGESVRLARLEASE